MKRLLVSLPGVKLEPNFPGTLIAEGTLIERVAAALAMDDGLPVVSLEPREVVFLADNADLLDLEVALLEGAPGVELQPMLLHLYDKYPTEEYGEIMKQVAIQRHGDVKLSLRRGGAGRVNAADGGERRAYDEDIPGSDEA